VKTKDIASRFKFFEQYKAPEKEKRQFRFTPPPEGQPEVAENEVETKTSETSEQPNDVKVVRSDTARRMLSKFREMEEKSMKHSIGKTNYNDVIVTQRT
jgi:hypothetical protein